jgi:signal transduction histidine kinase
MTDVRLVRAIELIREIAGAKPTSPLADRAALALTDLESVATEVAVYHDFETRLADINEAIFSVASLDLTHRAPIRDDGSAFDGLAAAVNMLCEEIAGHLDDRKRAEENLRRSEEQLRHAQKMEAVGRLAGGVAHDFNNILSVILSNSELMLETAEPGETREGLTEISDASRRAAALTRQLLTFSRQRVTEMQVVDLGELVRNTEKMLRRVLGEDIDLLVTSAPDLARIRADPGQMEQVLMNLVVNARDAMPHGGKLTLELSNVEIDEFCAQDHLGMVLGAHVLLAVTDNGIGMDSATQARIFEPFFTTKDARHGTGLGLSTVFGIVQQGGGTVWVYSEPGKGTTFKVYIPRAEGTPATQHTRRATSPERGTETILLTEDEPAIRSVASRVLQKHGYTVLEAADGCEALALCRQYQGIIHLLLTDIVMPNVSGPDLGARVRALRPDTRVLFMSGYTDDAMVRHGILKGRVPFLHKPLTPTSLLEKVRDVLRG